MQISTSDEIRAAVRQRAGVTRDMAMWSDARVRLESQNSIEGDFRDRSIRVLVHLRFRSRKFPWPGERVLARICAHCGDPFRPTREHQRFCQPLCRLAAFKARRERATTVLLDDELADVIRRCPFE
jgi:hypothetical protein